MMSHLLLLFAAGLLNAEPSRRVDAFGDPLPPGALVRMGTVRLRHAGSVQVMAFTPDGKSLLATSSNEEVSLWDAATGKERQRFRGILNQEQGFHFDRTAGTLTLVGHDNALRTWEIATGKELHHWRPVKNGIVQAVFTPDGKLTAVLATDPSVHLFETATGKEIAVLFPRRSQDPGKWRYWPTCLAISADGRTLAAGGFETADKELTVALVHLWDVQTGKELKTLRDPSDAVRAMWFDLQGKLLGIADSHQTILRELPSGKEVRKLAGPHAGGARVLALSPDGKQIALGNGDTLRLQDVLRGRDTQTIPAQHFGIVSAAFSPDGKILATGGQNHQIKLWDAATGKELLPSGGHQNLVTRLAPSPDGKVLASLAPDHTVRLWDAATGKELRVLRRPAPGAGNEFFAGEQGVVAFADGGRTIQAAWNDGLVLRWDATTGKERGHYRFDPGFTAWPVFSPTGRLLATADQDGVIRVREAATGKEMLLLKSGGRGGALAMLWGGLSSGLAFSPDERTLAASAYEDRPVGDGTILPELSSPRLPSTYLELWELATGKVRRQLRSQAKGNPAFHGQMIGLGLTANDAEVFNPGHGVVQFAPDGRTLAAGTNGVRLWDLATGQVRRRLGPMPNLGTLAYSPDGKLLAGGGRESGLVLWDAGNGKELHHSREQGGSVLAVAFSPDGSKLISSGADTTILVWDVAALVGPDAAKPAELTAERLEELWTLLAAKDAAEAFKALQELTAAPKQTVAFLKDRLRPAAGAAEEIRQVRAVEALEQIATKEARQLLEELANGKADARLTREAKAAAARLTRRSSQ